MFKQIVLMSLVTLIPALELRASIPYGIFGSEAWGITPGMMPWWMVMLVCALVNILLGLAVFWILAPILKWLESFSWFSSHLEPILERTQKKLKPYVDKYGEFGVAVFIGIPLPGSGVYTGAVGAFLLGLDRKKFAVANVIGVAIAAAVVTAVSLMLKAGVNLPWLEWILKH